MSVAAQVRGGTTVSGSFGPDLRGAIARSVFLLKPRSNVTRFLLAFVLALSPTVAHAASDRPNIVLILIDDLGWTDLGCMGSGYYETPRIDQFAEAGVLFTDAYSNGPNCAPTRACLLSGLYSPRHGIYTVGDPERGNDRFRRLVPTPNRTVLAAEFVTIAEELQTAGYKTAAMGKWHLGPDPTTQGFDVNLAGREWGSPSGGGYHSPYEYPNLAQPEPGEYLTDRLTTEACRFIEDHADQPFFLYLSHYAVHTPIQAKASLVKKYEEKPPTPTHRRADYAAMIESVDQSVGRILDTLADNRIRQRTIVIFGSDNGGFGGATANTPLRGAKGMLYEGGIRVPFIVSWPGVTPPGTRCAEPVMTTDIYPTLLEASATQRVGSAELDGESLLPLLRDPTKSLDRPALFWHFPCYLQGGGGRDPNLPFRTAPAGAIRMGDWKLIEYFEDGGRELFHLGEDPGEKRNLVAEHPAQAARLLAALQDWRSATNAPVPRQANPKYDPPRGR